MTTAVQTAPKTALKISRRKLAELRPDPRNARLHDERNHGAVRASLDAFGYVEPIVFNTRTRYVVGGHCRLDELRAAGASHADVVDVDLPPAKARALALALNRTGELAQWDDAKLQGLLEAIQGDDPTLLAATGFDLDDLSDLQDASAAEIDDDPIPPPPAKPVTRPGDLWRLGEHRLLCGDSTNGDHVKRLMAGKRAALFATDPPYLVEYDGKNHPGKNKQKRNKDWSALYAEVDAEGLGRDFYLAFCKVAIEHAIDERAAWYCWHASRRQAMLESVWEECGAFVHQQVIWAKTRGVLTRSVMLWQHEPCFFGWLKGRKPRVKLMQPSPTTVWQIPSSEVENHEHPTSKPVRVFSLPMELHTRRGDICFEPFCGSGSQVIAAEKTGRVCYAMELTPAFVDVTVRRWEALTGQKATREKHR